MLVLTFGALFFSFYYRFTIFTIIHVFAIYASILYRNLILTTTTSVCYDWGCFYARRPSTSSGLSQPLQGFRRGMEQRQLAWLITTRSQVRVLVPQPRKQPQHLLGLFSCLWPSLGSGTRQLAGESPRFGHQSQAPAQAGAWIDVHCPGPYEPHRKMGFLFWLWGLGPNRASRGPRGELPWRQFRREQTLENWFSKMFFWGRGT